MKMSWEKVYREVEKARIDPRVKSVQKAIIATASSGLFQKIDQCAGEGYQNCKGCKYAFRSLSGGVYCAKFQWHFRVPWDTTNLIPEAPCMAFGWCTLHPCTCKTGLKIGCERATRDFFEVVWSAVWHIIEKPIEKIKEIYENPEKIEEFINHMIDVYYSYAETSIVRLAVKYTFEHLTPEDLQKMDGREIDEFIEEKVIPYVKERFLKN